MSVVGAGSSGCEGGGKRTVTGPLLSSVEGSSDSEASIVASSAVIAFNNVHDAMEASIPVVRYCDTAAAVTHCCTRGHTFLYRCNIFMLAVNQLPMRRVAAFAVDGCGIDTAAGARVASFRHKLA